MAPSTVITIRVSAEVRDKAEARAKTLGYIKPSGEANISQYVRNLILNDRR